MRSCRPPKSIVALHKWRRRLKHGDKIWIAGDPDGVPSWPAVFSRFYERTSITTPGLLWVKTSRKTDGLAFTNVWFKMPTGRYTKWRYAAGGVHFPLVGCMAVFPLDLSTPKGARMLKEEETWYAELRRRYWRRWRPDLLHRHWTPKWLPEHLQ